jgi:hypothetical protein
MCKKKKCDIYSLLLFYNYFSSLAIQITSIILSIIGIIITNFGLSKIPFHINAYIYKFCFKLNILYLLLIIMINITFFVFSYLGLINNNLNLCAFILSIVEIYISFFGLIINLVNNCLILDNIKLYQNLANNKKSKKYPLLTDEQILLTEIIIIAIFFIIINLILLSFSDNLRINLQINGSYSNYKKSKNIEKDFDKKFKEENKPKKFKQSVIKIKNESINKLNSEIKVSINKEQNFNENCNIQESGIQFNEQETNFKNNLVENE